MSVDIGQYNLNNNHFNPGPKTDHESVYGLQKIDYSKILKREKSFEDWKFKDKPTPKELAEAGFYYTGESDKVVCFKCTGGVHEWEKKDIPMGEHKKYYPGCEFVLNPEKFRN